MTTYAIGDIQGRYQEFRLLLDKIKFSPESDRLLLLGDLVNRGPDSLSVVHYAMAHESSVDVVLGNHDLYLLAVLEDVAEPRERDTFSDVLNTSKRAEIKQWLCSQPLVIHDSELNFLAVHAGIHPLWSLNDALNYADEIHQMLISSERQSLMKHMFGNKPRRWSESLDGWKRLRFMINVFTRMRYIKRSGNLDFQEMRTLGEQKKNLLPWFDFPERNEIRPTIIFGHWSSLGVYMQPGILAMDSGCCWGRCLSAVRLDREPFAVTQIKCQNYL